MAEFEIRDSLRTYFSDNAIKEAVNALAEVLQGDNPPSMTWDEAKNYNQALLMAAQVRTDHNEMLFALWVRTFGHALAGTQGQFQVEFEPDYCTPESIWDGGFVWQTMSRSGLQQQNLTQAFEMYVGHQDHLIYLFVAKWDGKLGGYDDFSFDPAAIGSGTKWTPFEDDEEDVVARTEPVLLGDFLNSPEKHIPEMRAAADEMVAYLAKII